VVPTRAPEEPGRAAQRLGWPKGDGHPRPCNQARVATNPLLLSDGMDEAPAFDPDLADTVSGITAGRWPRRVRIALVAGLAAFACGAGVFAYGYVTRPETLTCRSRLGGG
jgi:hypothetical protein